MRKRIYRTFLRTAVLAATCGACTGHTEEFDASPFVSSDGEGAYVSIRLSDDGLSEPLTRSSFEWGESEIKDVQIVIVDKGTGAISCEYADEQTQIESLSFNGIIGHTYELWAAANLGKEINVTALSDFIAGTRTVSRADIAAKGIPMFSESSDDEPGPVTVTVSGKTGTAVINMVRMLARVDIKVDGSALDNPSGFKVKGVRIYNAINSYSPFKANVRQARSGTVDYSFDCASGKDLTTVNSGGTITLYAFENMQGDLLSGNTNPWDKVPSQIGGAADYCSYLELEGSYVHGGETYGKVTYRLYLGNDTVSNFDVKRNTRYTVTLIPTEEEVDGHRGSWKVESSNYSDDRSLAFSPRSLTIESLDSTSTTIVKSPADLLYDFSFDAAEASDAGLSIIRTGDNVSIVSTKELASARTVTLHVRTPDGTHHDSCIITVTPKMPVLDYELVLEPAKQTIFKNGSPASIKAVYYTLNNGIRVSGSGADVTYNATWSVLDGGGYIQYASKGHYNWKAGAGVAHVKAVYKGKEAIATINTAAYSPEVSYRLEIHPSEKTIGIGETIQFEVEEWKLEDGVETGHWKDISAACDWYTDDSSVATVSGKGLAAGMSEGVVTITAKYREADGITYEAEAELTVIQPAPIVIPEYIELEMAPDGIKIGEKSYGTVTCHYSDGSGTVINNSDCSWTNASGTGVFTGTEAGTFTVTVGYEGLTASDDVKVLEPAPVITVTPSCSFLETWGGNEYSIDFIASENGKDVGYVTEDIELVRIIYESGVPSEMHSWSPFKGKLAAKDWWGMTGNWTTNAHGFTLVFEYNGIEIRIPGEMNGTTGMSATIGDNGRIHYTEFEETSDKDLVTYAAISGIDGPYDVTDQASVKGKNGGIIGARFYKNYLDMGSYRAVVTAVDPTNGITREVQIGFTVETNIADIRAIVGVFLNGTSKLEGGVEAHLTSSNNRGTATLPDSADHDLTFNLGLLTFEDYKGNTYNLLSSQTGIPGWVQWDYHLEDGTYHRGESASGWVEVNGERLYWDIDLH